ncbi:p21-activated protein kinase-interacting protein 1-like [Orchesella cincta]|uniref:p21-activated protein kinase-interacting protein 1-like n=1 Tax=Orchesella cincta TaxID=48709 RepID=A0A1D2NIZ7_ORCCI|nr:p21-activated protein kinase-interacting protein 1-like [Orchesella cincta]
MAASDESSEKVVEAVEVVVGTYEEFILGYKFGMDEENEKYGLTMSFTNHSQSRSIRAIASVDKYIAAGSADESINLINIGARVEHGSLQKQCGTITCLTEHDGSYLFSGCEDGTICIWKKGSWLCEKTLKAHIGGVVDISVHPSGKLALSIGKDKAMKTWNLVKGRCGYVTNLKGVADAVKWSPEGDYYAVSISNRVDIYSLQTAKVVYSIPVGKRISCMTFLNDSTIAIAGDKEEVEIHEINSTKKLTEFTCHKVRVKAIQYVPEIKMLFTASNDGYIKAWSFDKKNFRKQPKLVAEIDTTCRITCMAVWLKWGMAEGEEAEEVEVEDEQEQEITDDDVEDSNTENSDDQIDDEDGSDEEQQEQVTKKRKKIQEPSKVTNKVKAGVNKNTKVVDSKQARKKLRKSK